MLSVGNPTWDDRHGREIPNDPMIISGDRMPQIIQRDCKKFGVIPQPFQDQFRRLIRPIPSVLNGYQTAVFKARRGDNKLFHRIPQFSFAS